jgi:hypothetical protein
MSEFYGYDYSFDGFDGFDGCKKEKHDCGCRKDFDFDCKKDFDFDCKKDFDFDCKKDLRRCYKDDKKDDKYDKKDKKIPCKPDWCEVFCCFFNKCCRKTCVPCHVDWKCTPHWYCDSKDKKY